jgi:hypothetical protein
LSYFQPGAGAGGGLSISDFGRGFVDTLDSGKITTSKLYNRPANLQLNNHFELSVTNGGVVVLPDQSVINGATLKTVPGNYAGITAGPIGRDEDSWVWVDNDGAWIGTKYSTDAFTWKFDNTGNLTLPAGGDILNSSGQSVLGGGGGVTGLSGTTYTPTDEGDTKYQLTINNDIRLKTYLEGAEGPNNLGPGFSLGEGIGNEHRSGVVAIGNDDVGYNSKRGGVYIGAEAGWNDEEIPQGEFAIAIGAFAARNFALDNSITLNATGEHFDPDESGLFIKPIREVVENTAKALYYNTTTGEVTYNDASGGSTSYTPDDTDNWDDPTINTISAALDELAARLTAIQNFEYDGGNANTPAAGELLIDGNGA